MCLCVPAKAKIINRTTKSVYSGEVLRSEVADGVKFPRITHDYQLRKWPNVYMAGVNAHSLDYRKSAGGFLHGFRYSGKKHY